MSICAFDYIAEVELSNISYCARLIPDADIAALAQEVRVCVCLKFGHSQVFDISADRAKRQLPVSAYSSYREVL